MRDGTHGRPDSQSRRHGIRADASDGQVVRVDDAVGVSLLGEELLVVPREVGVDGFLGHDVVEVGPSGTREPTEALGILLVITLFVTSRFCRRLQLGTATHRRFSELQPSS